MIMIDIFVPALYKAFDFEVDEKTTPEVVIGKVTQIIERYLGTGYEREPIALFSYRKGELINNHTALASQGILNGDRLILI